MFRHRKPTADDPQPQPAQTARVPPAMLAARRRKETLLPKITQLALEGHPGRAIADKLGMPKRTVNYWLQEENELRKFGREQTVGGGKKPGAEQNVCGLNDPIATNSELGETRQEKSPRKYPQSLFSGKFGQKTHRRYGNFGYIMGRDAVLRNTKRQLRVCYKRRLSKAWGYGQVENLSYTAGIVLHPRAD